MENWTEKAVSLMHKHRITQIELATHIGWTNDYVSTILLGKRSPKNAETAIMTAIKELVEKRKKDPELKIVLDPPAEKIKVDTSKINPYAAFRIGRAFYYATRNWMMEQEEAAKEKKEAEA